MEHITYIPRDKMTEAVPEEGYCIATIPATEQEPTLYCSRAMIHDIGDFEKSHRIATLDEREASEAERRRMLELQFGSMPDEPLDPGFSVDTESEQA